MTAQGITVCVWWPCWLTPYESLRALYHWEDPPYCNVTYWLNPEYDRLVDEENVMTGADRHASAQLFIEAQEIIVEESPAIWISNNPESWVIAADIEGGVLNPAYSGIVFFHDITTTR